MDSSLASLCAPWAVQAARDASYVMSSETVCLLMGTPRYRALFLDLDVVLLHVVGENTPWRYIVGALMRRRSVRLYICT